MDDAQIYSERTSNRMQRGLQPHWVWAIALGSAVGWGAFILPSDWIGTAGPLGALLGMLIGGILMVVVGFSYGFLASIFPVSGGAFAYTWVYFGRWHAFVCSWFMTLGYVAIVALNASALSVLARQVIPSVAEIGYLYTMAGWDVYLGEVLISSLALVFFAYLSTRGSKNSARVQFYLVILMVVAVVAILAGVLLSPQSHLSNLQPLFSSPGNPLPGIFAIVAIAPWAFIGFDNIPQTAEEFSFSPSKAFKLILWSLVFATALYLAMILVTAIGRPWEQALAANPVWLTADIVSDTMGPVGMFLLGAAAFFGIITGLIGFYIASSRALLAMGRAQMVPAGFAKLNARSHTPNLAVWFTMAVALVAPWFGRTALTWIVDMASIGFTIAIGYTCLGAFRMFQWSGRPSFLEGSASTMKKLLALAGVCIAAVFTLLLLVPGSPAQLSMPSLIALGVWIAIGIIFRLFRSQRGRELTDEEVDFAVLGKPRPDWARRYQ